MSIYFVSGHLDLSPQKFQKHYVPDLVMAMTFSSTIITSDSRGCDAMTQEFLYERHYPHVIVYHMFDAPRINFSFSTKGGFQSDTERDEAMTRDSTKDIAWVRPADDTKRLVESQGKKYRPGRVSGTEKNIIRRLQTK